MSNTHETRQMTRVLRAAVLASAAGAWSAFAAAHDLAQSESACSRQGATVTCRLTLDLLEFPGVDADRNQRVSIAELDASIARIFEDVKARLAVSSDQPSQQVALTRYDVVADEHVGRLEVSYVFAKPPSTLTVTSTLDQLGRPEHQHLVTVGSGDEQRQAVLDATARSVTLPLTARRVTLGRVLALLAGAALIGVLSYWRVKGAMRH
jgi:hypothetical protein